MARCSSRSACRSKAFARSTSALRVASMALFWSTFALYNRGSIRANKSPFFTTWLKSACSSVIGPETKEPIDTFKTGWMVPVDFTSATMPPRSHFHSPPVGALSLDEVTSSRPIHGGGQAGQNKECNCEPNKSTSSCRPAPRRYCDRTFQSTKPTWQTQARYCSKRASGPISLAFW